MCTDFHVNEVFKKQLRQLKTTNVPHEKTHGKLLTTA